MYSAIETAASFADAIAIHFVISAAVCVSPTSRNTCEPPIDAACSLTVTLSSHFIFPSLTASYIKRSVITFVTLAGGSFSSEFCSYKTVPVDASIKIALFVLKPKSEMLSY
ncbi:hypothetical protein SDC9_76293 [bioreactor metagenome]|uniref:Uncharacterized protein n=1 Tax=bioreactor metagenome TaxID=1076179 RepID=A0A644YMA2_9ZZZZ